jgi:hypothetical protein
MTLKKFDITKLEVYKAIILTLKKSIIFYNKKSILSGRYQKGLKKMKQLLNHESPDTAYIVNDYPYGFRLRTKIRYWIETKKGFGQRFVSQTLNPKNNKWNAPKKGNYTTILLMGLDEKTGYVITESCNNWKYNTEEEVLNFQEEYTLTDYQKQAIKYIIAVIRANKKIVWTIGGGESTQTREEQTEIIYTVISQEYNQIK